MSHRVVKINSPWHTINGISAFPDIALDDGGVSSTTTHPDSCAVGQTSKSVTVTELGERPWVFIEVITPVPFAATAAALAVHARASTMPCAGGGRSTS
jgi:hypothetical protein